MFGARGRSLSAIFATGPIITNDQSGRAAAAVREQRQVDPLVDHAAVAEPRRRDARLLLRPAARRRGRG